MKNKIFIKVLFKRYMERDISEKKSGDKNEILCS